MNRPIRLFMLQVFFCSSLFTQWLSVGNVDTIFLRGRDIEMRSGNASIRISFLSTDVVRVRAVPSGSFSNDPSVAVVKSSWPEVEVRTRDEGKSILLSSGNICVRVKKQPLRLSILDNSGSVLNEDAPRGMAWDGSEIRVWKNREVDEYVFGLGEKAGILNRTSKSFQMWNSDIPAYRADTDPLYQSVPFFFTIRKGRAQGIFFDNTYRSSFDFGVESDQRYAFGAPGGEIDYYVFAGPTPRRVLEQFTDLVGRMPLPPRWALGYQQSRWSYFPGARVRTLAKTFRAKHIPCDVIYFDIDYMDGFRVFTWSEKNFSQPAALLADLSKDGFKVVTIIDPGIKEDSSYHAYRSGLSENAFLSYPNGQLFRGKVWPGMCVFPDFSKPSARQWWGSQFGSLLDTGVRGFWTDMNEPSVFDVPTKTADIDIVHDDGGLRTSHAKNHNTYGLQMTQATYNGVREHRPNERPFILTRASFAGGHRYAAAWTGDNVSSWEHLQLAVSMCLGMSISGQPFVGSDIGGFVGSPDGELYSRWLQFGAFSPLMRTHTAINTPDQEPWSYGPQYERINKGTIELRYRFLPYIYNVMRQASETGVPAMRPLIFDYPSDAAAVWNDTEFLFGDDVLVAPVLWAGERERDVHLPKGVWYDYWTNQRFEGGKDVRVPAPIERIPLFIRGGAIVPMQQIVQHVDQAPVNPLVLNAFPADSSVGVYYGDDGVSFDYARGGYLQRKLEQIRTESLLRFTLGRVEGDYPIPVRNVDVRFIGVEKAPATVRVGGKQLLRMRDLPTVEGWYHSEATDVLHIRVKDAPGAMMIEAVMPSPKHVKGTMK